MKRVLRLAMLTAFVPILVTVARAEKRDSVVVSKSAQGIDFLQVVDISPWERLSAQASYTDGTPSSFSFTSGARSSATIVVSLNPNDTSGARSSLLVNIKSTATIAGKGVALGGILYRADVDFAATGVSTTTAAANLAVRLNATGWVASSLGSTVTVQFGSYGTSGNGIPSSATSTVNYGINISTFSGGRNQVSFFINGYEFKEGTNWTGTPVTGTLAFSSFTAINISTAINADSRVNALVVAGTTSLVAVTVRSRSAAFNNYSLTSNTTGLFTTGGFPGGANSDVDISSDIFTKTSHGLTTGLAVLVSTAGNASGGVPPGGLTDQTTFFAIKLNDNQYKLATSTTNAFAGTAIDITTVTDNAGMDIKPLALVQSGGNGFFWQVSNDSTTWTTLTGTTVNGVSVTSSTFVSGTNNVWDFGSLNFHYLRVNFKGPTSGGIGLTVRIFGKKD